MQTGDCCRAIREVVVTHAERALMERAAPSGLALTFAAHRDPRFARLLAPHGCPLLSGSMCSIYQDRPVNCRRYGCGRKDVTYERVNPSQAIPARFYTDRPFRRQMQLMERKAVQWGVKHGGWARG